MIKAADAKNAARTQWRMGMCLVAAMMVAQAALTTVLHAQGVPASAGVENVTGAALKVGKSAKATLEGGKSQNYAIHVEAGQFMHAVVTQEGIHVVLSLRDPQNKVLALSERLNGSYGPEPISIIAEQSEDLRLVVASLDTNAPSAPYEVRVTDSRAPTAADRTRMGTENAYMSALQLYDKGTNDSRIAAVAQWQAVAGQWHGLGDRYEEGISLASIVLVYTGLGDDENILDSGNRALAVERAASDRSDEAATLDNMGMGYAGLHRSEEALGEYSLALPLERSVGDRAGEAQTLNNIGLVYYDLEDRPKAVDYLNQALPLERGTGDTTDETATLNNLGVISAGLGKNQEALDYYNQAVEVERSRGDRTGEAVTLNHIGQIYSTLGDRQKELTFYLEAVSLERTSTDSTGLAKSLNNAGGAYSELGDTQTAMDYYSQALGVERAAGDQKGQAATLNSIGQMDYLVGHNQEALDYFNQALPLEHEAKNGAAEANTLNNIGEVYSALGEHEKALDYFNQALPLRRAASDRAGESLTLTSIGVDYLYLGENEKALTYFNQALPIEDAAGDRDGKAETLNSIGGAYSQLKDTQKAIDYYNQALPFARAAGDQKLEGATLSNIGSAYSDLGDYQKALEYDNQALPVERAAINRNGEAQTLSNAGVAYTGLGNKPKALENYIQALPLFQSIQDPLGEGEVLVNLMRYETSVNNAPLAVLFGKEAVDQFQELRRNIQGLKQEDQQSFLKSKEGDYRELAGILISAGRLPEAQQVLDMLKLEEFSEYTQHRGDASSPAEPVAYSDAEQTAKKQGDQIGAQITALGQEWAPLDAKRATLTTDEKNRYDDLSAQLQAANGQMRQYLAGLSSDFRKAETLNEIAAANEKLRNYKGETSDLQHLLEKADPGTVAVYTVVLPDRLSVILITPTTMFAHDVMISAIALRTKVSAFTQLFAGAAPADDDVRAKSQALYQMLFEPEVQQALDGAGAKILLWSLDDVLRYVPVAALYDGKQYLVERYQNVELTPDRSRLLEAPRMAGVTGVAMGISKVYNPADELGPLDSVPGELDAVVHSDAVSGSHGPIAGSIMLNDAFTEKNLVDALGRQPKVVHIASHYVYEAGSDENSYLLLGGKDTGGAGFHLTLADLEDNAQIKFDGVELLTLSGCETAVGANDADGHEVDALGIVATEQKNAKAVMATLWKVDDASAGQLMGSFYKLWVGTAGMSKAEALREAQLALLHGGAGIPTVGTSPPEQAAATRYSSPYYWAPFILIGNWK